jgi:hypothetical protein
MGTLPIDDIMLVAFADGELDPTTTWLVEQQIIADPALAERVELFRTTGWLLRAALSTKEHLAVPPALTNRISRLVAPPQRRWRPILAAAVVAGLMFAGAKMVPHLPFSADPTKAAVAHIMDEIADYHGVFASEREHLVDVAADRKDHLEAWLGDRLQFALKVPDLGEYGLEIQGGRLLAVDRLPVAQLMYKGKDGIPVALCIALVAGDATSVLQRHDDADTVLFGSGHGHYALVLVGPSSNPVLKDIADVMPGLLHRG